MNKRVTLLVLGILMLSYAPYMGLVSDSTMDDSQGLNTSLDRVEISPDPNSIRDLGQPTIYDGMEDVREVTADTVIGIYTKLGLIPRVSMDSQISEPRSDLAIALVDGEVGL